jgi:hypothetical protein
LVGIGVRRIWKPEVAVVPKYDAQSHQKQAERAQHQFPLFGIMSDIGARLRQQGAIYLGHDSIHLYSYF